MHGGRRGHERRVEAAAGSLTNEALCTDEGMASGFVRTCLPSGVSRELLWLDKLVGCGWWVV